ncbi:MAG: hypothetical protein AB1512_02840 [Thermodesulfobacteriota bacterium]
MVAETSRSLGIPGFRYKGFDVPAIDIPVSFFEDTGTGEPACKLAARSAPLAWRVAFYSIGRDLALDIEDAEALPASVKDAGKLVYFDAQERMAGGGWHRDGAYILPKSDAPKGMLKPKGDFRLARYFRDIEGFEEKQDGWRINPSPVSEESLIWLPTGHGFFIVPTMDGIYNPATGTPFETVCDWKAAVKRWVSAGLTEEEARKEISCFFRTDGGTAAVASFSGDYEGPLCVNLDGPGGGDPALGSFPWRRAAGQPVRNSDTRL